MRRFLQYCPQGLYKIFISSLLTFMIYSCELGVDPERQWYTHQNKYGANFIISDLNTEFVIEDSVQIYYPNPDGSSDVFAEFETGQFFLEIILKRQATTRERPPFPETTTEYFKFGAAGYFRSEYFALMFHSDSVQYPTHTIEYRPIE